MMLPQRVTIVEVGPRDGLQNEARILPVAARVELIRLLGAAGLRIIEAGSFVSPKRVPQMVGSGDVLRALDSRAGVRYPVLTPNLRGLEDAIAAGATEVAVFAAASEAFSQRNINCSIAESIARFAEVAARASSAGVAMRGYVSCALGCPYQGAVPPDEVARVAAMLRELGCDEISLGDTIGVGTPRKAAEMIARVAEDVALERLAVHFHDTYGQALANLYAALQCGVRVVDSAIAGLGGCPYAAGASGNVATEDVVYLLDGLGIDSGVDLRELLRASDYACAQLGCDNRSKAARALSRRT
ncbi:MAG: hydroxymethylglutaryl-CoA lyase [bacterium]